MDELRKIKFIILSRRMVENIAPYPGPHIIISVRTPGDPEEAQLPISDQTLATLRLVFMEEYDHSEDKSWQEYHQKLIKQGHAFTEDTGRLVLDFAARYADDIEAVIAHCDAGMARSPAISFALSKTVFSGYESEIMAVPWEKDYELDKEFDAGKKPSIYDSLQLRDFGSRPPTCYQSILDAWQEQMRPPPLSKDGHDRPCYYCGEPCNSLAGKTGKL